MERRTPSTVRAAAALLLLWAARPASAADPVPPYKDPALPFEKRVADLVGRMTLAEKADQVQMATPANARLGLPACNWWSEALHGVGRAGAATIFPQAIGLAATWDPPLIHDVAAAIGDEARVKYDPAGVRYRGLMLWCPTVNMARDPRWGRTEETFGEDPYLTGRIGVAYIKGLQGDDPKYLKAVATPKHFAAHSQEVGRMSRNVQVSEEVLRDYYLPAFRACFVEGGALSTMAAFNQINGVPCAANKWLLTDLLRDEWGFEGSVVSDWSGVSQLVNGHRIVQTDADAVAAALNAGLDVMSDPRPLAPAVIRAVEEKKLSEEVLTRAVSRNLLLRYRLGIFDPPEKVPFARLQASTVGAPAHVALALRSAREATVLLKNDPAPRGFGFERLLPLDLRRVDSLAVIGPYANVRQFGAYSAQSPAGSSPTILEAVKAAAGDRVQVVSADWSDPERAFRLAATSTVAVVVLGLNVSIEKEGIDRGSIMLPFDQQGFIEKVVAANPLTVVVVEGGSPIGLEWIHEKVPAVLNVWYPGEQGGIATAEVLFGRYNPAGRLPITYYRSSADLPPMDDYDITMGRTYMYPRAPVTYPFGHGLSYTSFDYGPVRAPAEGAADGAVDVAVDVKNAGPLDGDEVVQLYVAKPNAAKPRPQLQLKAFERVSIARGQKRTVTFRLALADLGLWDASARQYVVEPGAYELMVGASSADIRGRATLQVKEAAATRGGK
jgi:beta-glucosidase